MVLLENEIEYLVNARKKQKNEKWKIPANK
jgi:hypothetical protein